MDSTPRGPHPNDLIAPVDWALLAPQHPVFRLPDKDLISRMLWHVEHVPGFTADERALCCDLALHATWISQSGTKARGRWPGYLRLGLSSEVGGFRAMGIARRLMRSQRMAHDDEEWVLDLLGTRWDALRAHLAQGSTTIEYHDGTTTTWPGPITGAQLDWGDTHGMGAV